MQENHFTKNLLEGVGILRPRQFEFLVHVTGGTLECQRVIATGRGECHQMTVGSPFLILTLYASFVNCHKSIIHYDVLRTKDSNLDLLDPKTSALPLDQYAITGSLFLTTGEGSLAL